MNRSYGLFVVLFLLIFTVVGSASAADPITDAVEAILSGERVYIAPGAVDDVDSVKANLERLLRDDDNIVLIILPESVVTDTDINSVVEEISDKLGDSFVIGLVVGRDSVGYAPMLPIGIVTDQMRRANSVSNDPVTTLATFVQNMHLWMDKYPELAATPTPVPTATPTPSPNKDSASSSETGLWLVVGIVLLLTAVLFAWVLPFARNTRNDPMYVRKMQDLKEASDALNSIRTYLEEMTDSKVKNQLHRIFKIASSEIIDEIRAQSTRANASTIFTIKDYLGKLEEALDLYMKILSGRLRIEEFDSDFQSNLETVFFPRVEAAFKRIASELDQGDLKKLDNLVKSLGNQFTSRGIK